MCAAGILEQWQCVRCVYWLAGKNSAVIDCVGMSDSPCWSREADFFFPVTGEEHYLPCSEGCCWHTESSRVQASEIVGTADSTTLWSKPFAHGEHGDCTRLSLQGQRLSLRAGVLSITHTPQPLFSTLPQHWRSNGRSRCYTQSSRF